MLCIDLKYVLPMIARNFKFWYACNNFGKNRKLKGVIVVYTKIKKLQVSI